MILSVLGRSVSVPFRVCSAVPLGSDLLSAYILPLSLSDVERETVLAEIVRNSKFKIDVASLMDSVVFTVDRKCHLIYIYHAFWGTSEGRLEERTILLNVTCFPPENKPKVPQPSGREIIRSSVFVEMEDFEVHDSIAGMNDLWIVAVEREIGYSRTIEFFCGFLYMREGKLVVVPLTKGYVRGEEVTAEGFYMKFETNDPTTVVLGKKEKKRINARICVGGLKAEEDDRERLKQVLGDMEIEVREGGFPIGGASLLLRMDDAIEDVMEKVKKYPLRLFMKVGNDDLLFEEKEWLWNEKVVLSSAGEKIMSLWKHRMEGKNGINCWELLLFSEDDSMETMEDAFSYDPNLFRDLRYRLRKEGKMEKGLKILHNWKVVEREEEPKKALSKAFAERNKNGPFNPGWFNPRKGETAVPRI